MIRLLRVLVLPLLVWLSGPVAAQDYPDHTDLFVNDLAGVIGGGDAARLRAALEALRAKTGIEGTVLTLPQRPDDGRTLEAYATGLFNAWGIGDATRGDGFLVLVIPSGREMRLELGSGYDQDDDLMAQDIVSRVFLPGFREGDLSAGIVEGTRQVIDRIALRHAEGLGPLPVADTDGSGFGGAILSIAAAATAALVLLRGRIGGWALSLKRCPQCGARGLHRHEETTAGTGDTAGAAQTATRRIVTTCRACRWQEHRDVPARVSSRGGKSGGSFGGGRSSGGGATGRW